jgi:glutamate racemase
VGAPVLLFDSGLGGLSVLRELRLRTPGRQLVYVADDAAFPYGAWGEPELAAHIRRLFGDLLATWRPCLAVVACNTASTLVLSELRADHPGVRFVGTVPAIKPAAERTASGLISVLATPGTVRRAYTGALIRSFAAHARVQLVGSARLAAMAEASLRGGHRGSGLHALPVSGQPLPQARAVAGRLDRPRRGDRCTRRLPAARRCAGGGARA